MQLGMVGLGRMGANMVGRLLDGNHDCVVYDLNPANVDSLVRNGATGGRSVADLVQALVPPRAVWMMVPAGVATERTVTALAEALEPDDLVIDGGNTYFKDDLRRSAMLKPLGIGYVDVGTSGGVWGAARGYCLMIGGETAHVERLDPIFRTLAPGRGEIGRTPGRETLGGTAEQGYLHCGPVGAGHFVKMVHNGIEYGVMQAYAEGFDIMRNAAGEGRPDEMQYAFDLRDIAEVWRRGSVISSWLLDLTAQALVEDPGLDRYSGYVEDSGEGRWTVQTAIEEAVSADVLSAALYARFRSRQEHTFAEKVLSAMRDKFGGHVERPTGE